MGCGLGAQIMKYSKTESMQIGIGMSSRGEVALIMATRVITLGLLEATYFVPIIIVVLLTTIITPIMLKKAF